MQSRSLVFESGHTTLIFIRKTNNIHINVVKLPYLLVTLEQKDNLSTSKFDMYSSKSSNNIHEKIAFSP